MRIKVTGLTKSFGSNRVLQGIDLESESGQALGILGRNGAGKTTAIRIIMGEYTGRRLDTLSKGNQQKIQLAATLIFQIRTLLF